MGFIALLPFLLIAAFLLGAARARSLRVAALGVPIAIGVVYLVAWFRERQPPAQGDSQPGLVALVGIVVTAACVVAVLLGWIRHLVRDRRER